jgi:hypothetical protein
MESFITGLSNLSLAYLKKPVKRKKCVARACVCRECALVLGKDDEGRMTRDERLRLKQTFNTASGSRRCSYELYVTHTYGAVGSPALWFRFLTRAVL